MAIRTVTWVARRVDGAALAEARAMASALELTVLGDTAEKLILATADGDVVEYLTPAAALPGHLFEGQDTVIGFLVDDLTAAVRDLSAAGFGPIGEGGEGGGVRFRHVRGPGGVAYGLIQRT